MPAASPSFQLGIEKALRAFIAAQNVDPFLSELGEDNVPKNILCAHEKLKPAGGSFIAIVAALPDWETMVVNAIVRVSFEIVTHITDPDGRPVAIVEHSERVGKIIELFCLQNFTDAIAAFNAAMASWRGIGLTGWEAQPDENTDGQTETQLVATLPYIYEAFLES